MLKSNAITPGWERERVHSIGGGGNLACLRRASALGLGNYADGCDAVAGGIGDLAGYLGDIHGQHEQQRLFTTEVQMEMLDALARVLKPGAELRFATDDKSYLPYALERLMAHPAFDWLARGPADWKFRPADWPPTRYETKAIKGPPTFLRFARR